MSVECCWDVAGMFGMMAMAVWFVLLVSFLCEFGDGAGLSDPMLLITNGELYTPLSRGRGSVLTGGGAIVAILGEGYPVENLTGLPVRVVDAGGGFVVPGLIDIHVHVTGGGGEMGPASRTPEGTVGEIVDAGITTVVGVLGTDCVSRSLENLRVKVAALQHQGITAHMWSGCYRVPSPTLTGSLIRDLQLIDEVVGAGEIAMSDHRSSWPTTQELLGLVTDARVGGMLSGKAGVVHFHTGSADSLLQPLWDVVNASKGTIPLKHMIPTHVSGRGPALLKAAEEWVSKGGRVDFTSDQEGETASHDALMDWGKRMGNAALQGVSLSSDAFGSLPVFDSKGELVEYNVASPKANLNTIRRLVLDGKWALEDALQLSTTNPASHLSFKSKVHFLQGNWRQVQMQTSLY
ncbi:hypothetical protein KC19_2G188800 [Ceratodon purpureus]|uniref:Amidohydrolase-related domain-containing protein n=1 Tax=Ceratodon purpureus TaxID=3225 RepID=A0A8T0IXI5_CERPU|nr:hypothetical protein KC19_2G188800 [Ceratodon purpureus]